MTKTTPAVADTVAIATSSAPAMLSTASKFLSILPMNQALCVGDYVCSNNGIFFAVMQSDGNLCVYRGDPAHQGAWLWGSQATAGGGQFFTILQSDGNLCTYRGADAAHQGAWLWGSQVTADGGQFFAAMQDDGNLCVYKGTGPNDNKGFVWNSGNIDPVQDVAEIISIAYHVEDARVTESGTADLYRETLRNHTGQTQSSAITGSVAVAEMSGWSDALAVKVGVSTSFKTGIPIIAEGKVTVSLEVTNTYTWNGSTTTTKTWGFNTTASVPANSAMVALVSATRSTIVVPYTLTGTFTLRSGAKVRGVVNGTYTGSHSHDLTVTFATLDAMGNSLNPVSRALAITSESAQ